VSAEQVDAIVVGARCAGSATAIALARAGRRVVALDRAAFPADTLSTHLLFPGGVVELARLGAYERVRALGAPPLRQALVGGAGLQPIAPFTPIDGIDHGWCVRRPGLDAALVETAREAGAEVRERARVTDLVWDGGRVAGVRWTGAEGTERELRAPLVVGADGRRSTVGRLVGAREPYRSSANGRACFYAYFTDDRLSWRSIAAQWREGRELGTAFPCDGGQLLVLLMPPVERAAEFRADLGAAFARTVASMPALAERLAGGEMASKVRVATDTTSYFRRSSGPGWALPGDAGHFKDPVTAQGIRDALRFGRLLGEAVAPVLGDPALLDAAVAAWEERREHECLGTYVWTNALGRGEAMTPLEVELYRTLAHDRAAMTEVLDVFSRLREPTEVLGARRGLRLAATALLRPGADRRATLRATARELRDAISLRTQRTRGRWLPWPSPSSASSSRRGAGTEVAPALRGQT
jgi:flavin-dependent dehydrogenase